MGLASKLSNIGSTQPAANANAAQQATPGIQSYQQGFQGQQPTQGFQPYRGFQATQPSPAGFPGQTSQPSQGFQQPQHPQPSYQSYGVPLGFSSQPSQGFQQPQPSNQSYGVPPGFSSQPCQGFQQPQQPQPSYQSYGVPPGFSGQPGQSSQGFQQPFRAPQGFQSLQSGSPSAFGAAGFQVQPQGGYSQPLASNNMTALTDKLQTIIAENRLQAFYGTDPSRLQAVLAKLSTVNFDSIAQQWRISKELAYDLAPLALYDIVFYCDDSGSMAFCEDGERITDLKFILNKVAEVATVFDDDGIVVRFMNSNVDGNGVKNATDVHQMLSQVSFNGQTPLGTNLDRKVIQPLVIGQATAGNMAKPVLVIAITDGEPTGESKDTVIQVVSRAKDALSRTKYGPGAFALEIAQVGKDTATQRFLEKIDNDPHVGNMIDCTSYYEMEAEEFARKNHGITLTPELWLLKMCMGAIDRSYDEKD